MEPLTDVLLHLLVLAEHTDPDNPWLDQARLYLQPQPRNQQLVIRLTVAEKLELQRRAQDAGQKMSDYARVRIFKPD